MRAIARLMIAAIFVMGGLHKLQQDNHAAMGAMIGEKLTALGVDTAPFAEFLIYVYYLAIFLELAGGAALALGGENCGAVMLLMFLIPVTGFMHNFWDLKGAKQQEEMVQFLKNVSIAGGLLAMLTRKAGGSKKEKSD
eukprot:PLAT15054.1.p1 GENE.PLAT15054.1~~PLAT15054.1.p1  ORF type:complete len:138 (+),score=73.41 PLAT15054.1:55-468(+)